MTSAAAAPRDGRYSRTAVFVGPSLQANIVSLHLPGARVFPPVKGGDLSNVEMFLGFDRFCVLDGYYFGVPAVRHAEILRLLSEGKRVLGGASMGALRAAELDACGMEGIGKVYEWYKSGTILGDDEIALVHADEYDAYKGLTVALVEVRHWLMGLEDRGVIASGVVDDVVSTVQRLPFYERHERDVLSSLERVIGGGRTRDVLRSHPPAFGELKSADALATLKRATNEVEGEVTSGRYPFPRTVYSQGWRWRSRGTTCGLSLWEQVRVLQLLSSEFASVIGTCVLRATAVPDRRPQRSEPSSSPTRKPELRVAMLVECGFTLHEAAAAAGRVAASGPDPGRPTGDAAPGLVRAFVSNPLYPWVEDVLAAYVGRGDHPARTALDLLSGYAPGCAHPVLDALSGEELGRRGLAGVKELEGAVRELTAVRERLVGDGTLDQCD